MKNLLNKIPLITVLMLIMISCEEVIEFRGERTDPKLVIYSLLNPDSVISVSISKSHAVFDHRYKPQQITNASVRLFGDGVLLESLVYVPPMPTPDLNQPLPHSKYVSAGLKPVPGVDYRIEAEVNGMKMASGGGRLPSPVAIMSFDTISITREDNGLFLNASIRFSDPPGEENFYRIYMRRAEGFYYGDHSKPYDPESPVFVNDMDFSYVLSNDPLIAPVREEDLFGMYIDNMFNIFSDELISGKQYVFNMKLNYKQPDTAHYEFLHFDFELQAISKELYLYLQSYSAHIQTRNAFMSEPVLVYTNIEDGLGVVGTILPSVESIRIGRYPVDGVTYRKQNQYW